MKQYTPVAKSNREKVSLLDETDANVIRVWFVKNYPESFKEMSGNPEIRYKFSEGAHA